PLAHTARTFARYRENAWKALNLYDEHTWGADLSLRAPDSEDTASQWYFKANYAYEARSLSLMLQRDALADFSHFVPHQNADDVLLFNPLPWPRCISGEVPYHVANPRGLPADATSGRHSQDRVWSTDLWVEAAQTAAGTLNDAHAARLAVPPVEVPGYGFTLLKRADLVELKPQEWSERAVVENKHYRLAFDVTKGGVISWHDKQLAHEWVDSSAGYPLNGFCFEQVADHDFPWPRWLMFHMQWDSDQVERARGWKAWRAERAQPHDVLKHRVYNTPFGQRIIQVLKAPGIAGPLTQSVFLPNDEAYVEFESWWVMGQEVHPEGTYVVFPFNSTGRRRAHRSGRASHAGRAGSNPRRVLRLLHGSAVGRSIQPGAGSHGRPARQPNGAVRRLPLWRQPARLYAGTRHAARLGDQHVLGDQLPRAAAGRRARPLPGLPTCGWLRPGKRLPCRDGDRVQPASAPAYG
ncbi:MAG: hypothetical protein M1546_19115, partial [Chloroflexi bacterium]|nr:hypothetical protein [Chloroflexota bacterium]